jgi:type II secretion system protein C
MHVFLATTNRSMPWAVSAVLGAVLAAQLAALARVIGATPTLSTPIAAEVSQASAQPAPSESRSALLDAHLFGELGESLASPQTLPEAAAPATALNVRLTGILFAEGEPSQAIIAGSRSERIYGVGEALEDNDGVTLSAVSTSHVLLERDHRLETLWLPKDGNGAGADAANRTAVAAAIAVAAEAQPAIATATATAAETPQPLNEIMLVGPQLDETGAAAGFALSPGRNMAAFAALGLESGERVIDVNGIALGNDPNEGPKIFTRTLGAATEASLTVLRGDSYERVDIDSNRLVAR